MQTKVLYCTTCMKDVRILITDAPTHEGHANIPDGPDLICCECGEACRDGACPVTNLSYSVMRSRVDNFEKES